MKSPDPHAEILAEIDHFLKDALASEQTSSDVPKPLIRRFQTRVEAVKPAMVWPMLAQSNYWRLRQASFHKELTSESVLAEINVIKDDLKSIREYVSSQKENIDRLCEELEDRPIIKHTQLFDIDKELYVIQPIPVVIEEYENEVIASFPEIEVFGVGANEPEALISLKSEIKDLYYDLIESPKETLGKLPLSWYRVLERIITKIGDA